MGTCSLALYTCLVSDLSSVLSTVPWSRLISNDKIDPWPGITERQVAALALRSSLLKKFEDEKSASADEAALTKFLTCNTSCERFTTIDVSEISSIEEIALGEFKNAITAFFFEPGGTYWLNPQSISERIAVGPGASVGVSGDSFYHKIAASKLTGTRKSLYSLYKRECARYPLWLETEKIRSDHFGDFVSVQGSRLSFVPKSTDVSRTICTEPLLNMLFQKGIGSLFESELSRRFGINLSTQPDKNKELARIGSKSGAYGTIDLSSASDSISLNLCREILPSYVNSWLLETRSEVVTLPSGEPQVLHMVSSMGNAFTFPLQTILFAAVVLGVYRALDIRPVFPRGDDLGNFAVFGDDIIVRREAYSLVTSILRRLGFSVNLDKSFNEGPFRESCGSDFWNGYGVRGVYCRSLKTKQDVYSLINRLNVWSANHSILLPLTVGFLMHTPGLRYIPVPPWESDVAGVKVPSWLLLPSQLKRSKKTGSIVYQRYQPRPYATSLLNVGSRPQIRHGGRNLIVNPPGILLAAVGGYLRDGKILSRERFTKYLKRFAVAPCWDYFDPSRSTLTSGGWHRWKSSYVYMNLGSDSYSG